MKGEREKSEREKLFLDEESFPAPRFRSQIVYFETKANGALWKLKMSSEIEFFLHQPGRWTGERWIRDMRNEMK